MSPAHLIAAAGRSTLLAALIGLGACLSPVAAQEQRALIQFTSTWRYDQSGTDLGTAWRTNGYDDSTWRAGPGLFYYETTSYPQPFTTSLNLTSPAGSQITTYYFRTEFEFTGNPAGVSLIASNLVDDGCIIHLNGVDAGRIRMSASAHYFTLASGAPPVEGEYDVINLNAASLRSGTNVLAVEVHQSAIPSPDVVWGMSLKAAVPTPVRITGQPQGQTVVERAPVSFSVAASGSPLFYGWMRNGTAITNATNAVFGLIAVKRSDAGIYSVIVSNGHNAVTSAPATLTVLPDTFGPKIRSAWVVDLTPTNFIQILLSETVDVAPVGNLANYDLRRLNDGARVPVTNATRFASSNILLRVGPSNWVHRSDYVLTVNGIRDDSSNRWVIAPNTQVPIGWPRRASLAKADDVWTFHAAGWFESDAFDQGWQRPDFVPGFWWAEGAGGFYVPPAPFWGNACSWPFLTSVSFQPEPMLFRRSFQWTDAPTLSVNASARMVVDDAMVIYLNGEEAYRDNLPSAPTPLSSQSFALNVVNPSCRSVSINLTNLVIGTNWIAAALFQPNGGFSDAAFALEVEATVYDAPSLPTSPDPVVRLEVIDSESYRVRWDAPGYALESATNLGPTAAWFEVPNMSNPYVNQWTNSATRFFRLKK